MEEKMKKEKEEEVEKFQFNFTSNFQISQVSELLYLYFPSFPFTVISKYLQFTSTGSIHYYFIGNFNQIDFVTIAILFN